MSAQKVIEDLIETAEDGRKGFEQSADKLREDGHALLADQMSEFSRQRGRFANELREVASASGVDVAEKGSVAGALHRGWMALADALSGDDPEAVLSAAESGEDHAVSEYEDALEDDDLTGDLRDVVSKQAAEVRRAHDRVRQLRDEFGD